MIYTIFLIVRDVIVSNENQSTLMNKKPKANLIQTFLINLPSFLSRDLQQEIHLHILNIVKTN